MTEIESSGKTIKVDDDDFLEYLTDWSVNVSKNLASQEGLKNISDEQMEIIKFLRNYYAKFKAFPILNYVCKSVRQPRESVNEEFINPGITWKLAGLPKPSGGVFYLTISIRNSEVL